MVDVQCKYTDRALGLILVSPLARTPSWTEWLNNQVCQHTNSVFHVSIYFINLAISCHLFDVPASTKETPTDCRKFQALISLLYFCGMTGFVKEKLLQRYFSAVSTHRAPCP